jgi:hypothetical protein
VDSAGIPLDGTSHSLTFSVCDDATGASAVRTETLPVVFANGFYTVTMTAYAICATFP